MPQDKTTNNSTPAEVDLLPAIIADLESVEELGSYLRHFFIGLADELSRSVLICPPQADTSVVGAAPVDIIGYPPIPGLGTVRPVLKSLAEKLRRMQISVLHCVSPSRMKATARLAHMLDVPHIVSINSLDGRSWRKYARNCSRVIAPSESIASGLKTVVRDESKIRMVPMGTFVSEQIACYRQSPAVATIVMVEQLDDARALDPLFNAIKHLSIDGVEMVVALMGSGKAEWKVRRLAGDLGLSHVVNIVPEVRPLRHVFGGADIFVRARSRRRFDFALLEAMSEGTAVAGCTGAVEELMVDGRTAAVFEEGNELSIYNALGSLLRDRACAMRLARNGQELLRERYKVSSMLADMLAVYRAAVEEHKNRPR